MPDSATTPPQRPSTNAPQDAGKKTAPSTGKTTKRAAASPATKSTGAKPTATKQSATRATATKSPATASTAPKSPKPPKAETEVEAIKPVTAPDPAPAPELVTPPGVDPLSARLDLLVQEGGPRLSKSAMKVVQRRMAASEAAAIPVATPVDSHTETAPATAEAATAPSALAVRSAAALRAQFERIREQSGALYTRLRPGSAICSLCNTPQPAGQVTMFSAARAGDAGRAGNSVGTYICADLACSLLIRIAPPSYDGMPTTANVIADRVAGLESRVRSFGGRVLESAS